MDKKQLKDLCDALKYIGGSISEDEPLNFSLSRGLDRIAETISNGLNEIANAIQIAARIRTEDVSRERRE